MKQKYNSWLIGFLPMTLILTLENKMGCKRDCEVLYKATERFNLFRGSLRFVRDIVADWNVFSILKCFKKWYQIFYQWFSKNSSINVAKYRQNIWKTFERPFEKQLKTFEKHSQQILKPHVHHMFFANVLQMSFKYSPGIFQMFYKRIGKVSRNFSVFEYFRKKIYSFSPKRIFSTQPLPHCHHTVRESRKI